MRQWFACVFHMCLLATWISLDLPDTVSGVFIRFLCVAAIYTFTHHAIPNALGFTLCVSLVLCCCQPAIAESTSSIVEHDCRCVRCNKRCDCGDGCICPQNSGVATRTIYFQARNRHPIYAAAHGTVSNFWGWLVPEPKPVFVPVEVLEVTPAQVLRNYRPVVK